jgi:Mrp family chromosome partitioning ATPase
MPLRFLTAGKPCVHPSDILRSAQSVKAFAELASQFEWIVVDSTPMLPIGDVNLWSRLVDGTLLVVREGLAPVKALKKGLQALDHPKLIGLVLNEGWGLTKQITTVNIRCQHAVRVGQTRRVSQVYANRTWSGGTLPRGLDIPS